MLLQAFAPELLLWIFLYFCRIGAMLMTFPGFGSARIPVQVRLFLAVAVTFALMPLLLNVPGAAPPANLGEMAPAQLLHFALAEVLKGLAIGLMARIYLLMFEFMLSAVAMYIGMGNFPGAPAEGTEPVPALVTFVTLAATALIFITGLHVQVLAAIVESYGVSPVGRVPALDMQLSEFVGQLSRATWVTFQATAPFLLYAVIVNLAIGLINRLTPQIPAYFISLPMVLLGGLLLLLFVIGGMLEVFLSGFAEWLLGG